MNLLIPTEKFEYPIIISIFAKQNKTMNEQQFNQKRQEIYTDALMQLYILATQEAKQVRNEAYELAAKTKIDTAYIIDKSAQELAEFDLSYNYEQFGVEQYETDLHYLKGIIFNYALDNEIETLPFVTAEMVYNILQQQD
jgi:hypothetical protein